MSKTLWNLCKLGIAGAVIFGIGWAITVSDPEDGVKEAKADIQDFLPTQALLEQSFSKTVKTSGLEPRPYEMNGNDVFFAVAYVEQSPEEVLDFYQDAFVKAGINDKKYTEIPQGRFERTMADIAKPHDLSPEELEYDRAMLTGGVVPVIKHSGYMAMGGIVPKAQNQKLEEIVDAWALSGQHDRMSGVMDGFRFIDARQWPGQRGSRITSVWAEEGFDASKMANPQEEGVAPVLQTPVCMGCTLALQMKSRAPDERFRIGHFVSGRNRDDIRDFYETAMFGRGWKGADAPKAVEMARQFLGDTIPRGSIQTFSKVGSEAWIAVYDDPQLNETSVMVVESF